MPDRLESPELDGLVERLVANRRISVSHTRQQWQLHVRCLDTPMPPEAQIALHGGKGLVWDKRIPVLRRLARDMRHQPFRLVLKVLQACIQELHGPQANSLKEHENKSHPLTCRRWLLVVHKPDDLGKAKLADRLALLDRTGVAVDVGVTRLLVDQHPGVDLDVSRFMKELKQGRQRW